MGVQVAVALIQVSGSFFAFTAIEPDTAISEVSLTLRVVGTLPKVGPSYDAGSIPILSFTAEAIRCVQPR